MRDRKSHRAPPRPETPRTRPVGPSEKGTISIHFVRPVAAAVVTRGLDAAGFLREAGIAPALLDLELSRVSPQQYSALWRLFIQRLDDEFFFQDARRMKAGSFALLCRAVVHCTNLSSAIGQTGRYLGILLDDLGIELSATSDAARISLLDRRACGGERGFAHETLLVIVHGLACWLVGRRIPILRAGFAYPKPAHAREYAMLFSAITEFDCPRTFVEFDSHLLDLPVVQNDATVKEFLRVAPENILLKYKNEQGLVARVRRRLRQILPDDLPELDSIAREFHTAPATLRRRLRAEGQSYQSIKDDLRRDLAITYLSSTTKSVQEIARAVGFREPSAFHRAFHKWAHISPGAYRRADVVPASEDAAHRSATPVAAASRKR